MTAGKEIIKVGNSTETSWEEKIINEPNYPPFLDIYETDDNFVLIANLPGVSRENVKVKLDDDTLLIFGRINYQEAIRRKYIVNENDLGNYLRRLKVSNGIDKSKIEAKYENGQLEIILPKHEKLKSRTIYIR
jgi:HSP20 family molecular chaperone IbpA